MTTYTQNMTKNDLIEFANWLLSTDYPERDNTDIAKELVEIWLKKKNE